MAQSWNVSRSRRALARAGLGGIGALALSTLAGHQTEMRAGQGTQAIATQSLPVRWPGRLPGDGFLILHGYATENTAFAPGWWHTGENWYAIDGGDTAGAEGLAVAPGVVVFAGYDYPGPVVIVQHQPYLYSMYGHLDYVLKVQETDVVEAGQPIGTVLNRTDGESPSHLHFEIRTFLIRDEINGSNPSYGVHCGYQCAPGPGYWPMDAPEHPSQLGWLNPLEEMSRWRQGGAAFDVVGSQSGVGRTVDLLAGPDATAEVLSTITLTEDATFTVAEVATAPPDGTGTSAEAYAVWYRTTVDGVNGWFSAIATSDEAIGLDGRPSAVELLVVPAASGAAT